MFTRKKRPVLTANTCILMEMVRMSVEVLYGKRVTYDCIDFNTCHAKVWVGDEIVEIVFMRSRGDLISLQIKDKWYTALFGMPDLVRVGCDRDDDSFVRKTVAGEMTIRWVGRSYTERWEEPLFLEQAQYCADIRGLTLQELLNP